MSEDARMKNSIKYANGFDVAGGKLTGSAIYQFGNASGDTSKGYGLGLQAGYENDLFGIQVAYDKFEDAIAAGVSGAAPSTALLGIAGDISALVYNTEATLVALKLTPNKEWKFKGGWEWYDRQHATDTLSYGSLWGYNIQSGDILTKYVAGQHREYNVLFAGAEYDFAERFAELKGLTLAVGYYDTITGARQNADGTQSSGKDGTGTEGTWTAVLDYKLNKRFDVYGAYTHNHFAGAAQLSGGDIITTGTGATNIDAYGLGVRMKF